MTDQLYELIAIMANGDRCCLESDVDVADVTSYFDSINRKLSDSIWIYAVVDNHLLVRVSDIDRVELVPL